MDPVRFDTLVKSLSTTGTRRRLLHLVAALPLAGAIAALLTDASAGKGRREKRKARHHQDQSKRQTQRQHKHTQRGQAKRQQQHKRRTQRQDTTPTPAPGCMPTTCAAQGKSCGSIPDGCGRTLDCGPCTCATGCHPVCQRCNPATDLCDPIVNGTGCDDGNACTQTDTCQNGVCVGSNPKVCPALDECHDPGTCDPATGVCSSPSKTNGTECTGGFCCGGECKECCTHQDCPSGFCHGHKVCAPKECTEDSCDFAGGVICGMNVNGGAICHCYKRAGDTGLFCAESLPGIACSAGTCSVNETCVDQHGPQCPEDDLCAIPCTWPT